MYAKARSSGDANQRSIRRRTYRRTQIGEGITTPPGGQAHGSPFIRTEMHLLETNLAKFDDAEKPSFLFA
jgi:hypothetical protein